MHSRRIHGTKLFMMLPINQASQKMRPLVLLSLINFLRHLSDFKLETKYNFLSRTYRVKKSSFQMFPYPKMILSLSHTGMRAWGGPGGGSMAGGYLYPPIEKGPPGA